MSTNIEIEGPGADELTVRRSAGGSFGIFKITSSGTVSISGLTISNGISPDDDDGGGGIRNGGGTVKVSNSTISGNSALGGGGIYNASGGTVSAKSSIVAGNTGGDTSGALTNGGFNFVGGDPKLGPLQDNGGPTETHLPLDDSPIIDQGNSFAITDQRGAERSQDTGIPNAQGGDGSDIGAVEVEPIGISIGNAASVTEGDTDAGTLDAFFVVRLWRPSAARVTVDYATSDDTAVSSEDYEEASGILIFDSGQTSKTVVIEVKGDTLDEPEQETFYVDHSNPQGPASVFNGSGRGEIVDNDMAPSLSVDDVTVTEGSSGSTDATFIGKPLGRQWQAG